MKLVSITKFDRKKLDPLLKEHLGRTDFDNGLVYTDNFYNVLGYVILKSLGDKAIAIDWIYAQKGFGSRFLRKLEKVLKNEYDRIVLKVSIDPHEKKDTVIGRMNFYIKNRFRVVDIDYREKHGPLVTMVKYLRSPGRIPSRMPVRDRMIS